MEKTIKTYQSLNKLAAAGSTVIFGDTEDRLIPLGELKDSFDLQDIYYNRSLPGLCLDNAIDLYNRCVATLAPQELYLHIGSADKTLFCDHAAQFDLKYSQLVGHIRSTNKKCNIAIISLKNPDADPVITQMNKHLAAIAQNEGCAFCDISKMQVWNPQQTKEVVSFLYSIGFVRPLKQKHPLQEIAKILFCYDPAYIV